MALEPKFAPVLNNGIDKEALLNIAQDSLKSKLQAFKIDPNEPLVPPDICLSVTKNNESSTLCTLGNFSLVIGKAKSRKSFLMALLIASASSNKIFLNCLKGELPKDQSKILYFDTEQAKYHVQKAFKRICRLIDSENPNSIEAYFLRGLTPLERKEEIEKEIYSRSDIGFVIIDGIRDLVTSINDEEQATSMGSWLLRITQERNIHIVTVLHQNKGDNNARGHLGTELVNKAETVLSVTKDKDISIVEAEFCRDKDPEPFAFEIDNTGLPIEAQDWKVRTSSKKEALEVDEITELNAYKIVQEALSKNKELGYSELVRQIKLAFKNNIKKSIGDNKAKEFISYCKNQNWLIQPKEKAPYSLGEFS